MSDHVWAMWDFMPTVAELVGVKAPENNDGISILPTLLGQPENQKEHEFLYWEYKAEQAVRLKNWYGYKSKTGEFELYNLIENPEQNRNVAAANPEITNRILQIMKTEHSPSDVWPSPGESDEEFIARLAKLGVEEKPENIAEF